MHGTPAWKKKKRRTLLAQGSPHARTDIGTHPCAQGLIRATRCLARKKKEKIRMLRKDVPARAGAHQHAQGRTRTCRYPSMEERKTLRAQGAHCVLRDSLVCRCQMGKRKKRITLRCKGCTRICRCPSVEEKKMRMLRAGGPIRTLRDSPPRRCSMPIRKK